MHIIRVVITICNPANPALSIPIHKYFMNILTKKKKKLIIDKNGRGDRMTRPNSSNIHRHATHSSKR